DVYGLCEQVGLSGVDRFSVLRHSNPQLNSRILSRRLRELEEAGMIMRIARKRTPGPVRWAMTEKGVDILPAIIRLIAFGARMASGESVPRKTSEEAHSFITESHS